MYRSRPAMISGHVAPSFRAFEKALEASGLPTLCGYRGQNSVLNSASISRACVKESSERSEEVFSLGGVGGISFVTPCPLESASVTSCPRDIADSASLARCSRLRSASRIRLETTRAICLSLSAFTAAAITSGLAPAATIASSIAASIISLLHKNLWTVLRTQTVESTQHKRGYPTTSDYICG